jgi:hypothetical protein
MADNEISILVKAEVAKALTDLKSVNTAAEKQKGTFESMFSSIKTGYLAIAGVIGGAVAGALGALTKKGIEFLDLQDDFNSLFSGLAGSANKMRDSLVRDLGLSTEEVTKMLSQVGILTQSMGFNTEKSLDMASKITTLSVAIERFSPNGVTAAQATDALTAALNGQDRGLRQLGISVSEQDKLQKASALGIRGTTAEWTKQEAAQVILAIAYDKSGAALDGLSAKNRSMADNLKIVSNQFDDLKTGVGIELAQTLATILPNMDGVGRSINDIRKVARPVIDVLLALGQTMILAFTIPGSVVVATVKSIVTLARSTAALTNALIHGNFEAAKVEAETLAKQTAESVRNIAVAPLDVLKATGASYITAFKSITGEIKIEEAKNDKESQTRGDKRISDNVAVNAGILESEKKRLAEQKKLQEEYDANQATYNQFIAADKTAKEIAELEKRKVAALAAADALGRDRNAIIAAYDLQLAEIEKQAALEVANQWVSVFSSIAGAAQSAGDFLMQMVQQQVDAENAGGKKITEDQKKRLKDAAIAQKAIALFQAGVNTASAIVAALATPLIGPALAIAAGITGGLQTAIIAAKPIPEFALGGIVNGPQAIIAGERGREAVLPNDLTELLLSAAGQGRGGATVNIGQVVANDPQQFAAALDRHIRTRGNLLTI